MVVTVRGGVVESRRYVDTGQEVSPTYASSYPTVDGLFLRIEDALARNAAQLSVTYDPERGVPTSISIDYQAQMVDDEVLIFARDFAAR